eukprot:scaffold21868_cov57-Isochrysis_galbana.AAC.2
MKAGAHQSSASSPCCIRGRSTSSAAPTPHSPQPAATDAAPRAGSMAPPPTVTTTPSPDASAPTPGDRGGLHARVAVLAGNGSASPTA